MNYAIVEKQWMEDRGLVVEEHMRKSIDGTKVILHDSFLRPYFGDAEMRVYYHDDPEFIELLSSPEWSAPEEIALMTAVIADGAKDNPYEYDGTMPLSKGKFYTQDGIVYECIRSYAKTNDSPLKDLVGTYVKESA